MPRGLLCSEARVCFDNQPVYLSDDGVQDREYVASVHMPVLRPNEGYVRGECYVHIHVGIRACRREEYPREFCALLKRFVVKDQIAGYRYVPWAQSDIGIQGHQDSRMKNAVFVYPRQKSEHRESMSLRVEPVRSWIRLSLLDECPVVGSDVSQHRFRERAVPVAGTDADRPSGGTRGVGSSFQSKLPRDVIECGTNLVENVSDENSPPDQWRRCVLLEAERCVKSLSVVIADDCVRVSFDEQSGLSIKRFQMLTRPIEFCANAIQRGHALTSP
jgi:hypothetical protein